MFERFLQRFQNNPKKEKLSYSKAEIQSRAMELNSMVDLAQDRRKDATERMLHLDKKTLDILIPIIQDLTYAERIETTSIWVTSMINSDGGVMKAWDLVDEKFQERRDYVNNLIDDSNVSET